MGAFMLASIVIGVGVFMRLFKGALLLAVLAR